MNKTLWYLLLSDIFVVTGFGLMEPILAIFIKENLVGGTIFSAGVASAIFLVTKSLIQLPFSRYVDKHGKKLQWLIFGTALICVVPFIYIFASDINLIYVAQFIYGIGSGLAYPTWLGLWSTNLDKRHESFEWSLYSTLSGLGTAVAATIGAAIAQFVGYKYTFVIVGVMALVGCLVLLGLELSSKKKMKQRQLTLHEYQTSRKLTEKY
jgi:MFS family permease